MKENKFKDKEYIVRLKEQGRKILTYYFKGKSLEKVMAYVRTFAEQSFRDTRWTICESCCEVKRGGHIWNEEGTRGRFYYSKI